MDEGLLDSAEAVAALAERLSNLAYVEDQATPHKEPPSWTLADGLRDIESECRRFLDERLPLLVSSSGAELDLALAELRVGMQHIVYHLATTPWSRSLIDEAPPLFEES
jgi:hypothetical protein